MPPLPFDVISTEYPLQVAVQVERYLAGVRIDTFLARHFRNYTSFRLMRLVAHGLVQIDGAVAEPVQRVQAGQRVTACLLEPPDKLLEPEAGPLNVLYDDGRMLAVCKPAGQIVHPVGNTQTGTLANRVQAYLDVWTPLPGLLRPGIVHRLDRETSGVIVVPVEHVAHRELSIQFQQGEMEKTYLALVEGSPARDSGTIDLPLGTWPGGQSILVSAAADARNPRPAVTRYRVRERFKTVTLIEAQPLTGRIHQIRVHLATIGHPVVADEYYGMGGSLRVPHAGSGGSLRGDTAADGTPNGKAALMRRHALHAWQLTVTHPITGKRLTLEAPLTDDFEEALNQLRAERPG